MRWYEFVRALILARQIIQKDQESIVSGNIFRFKYVRKNSDLNEIIVGQAIIHY